MDVKAQHKTKQYVIYNDDCCKVITKLKSESVHFSVFSPPFASLYSYSDDPADMGNCRTYEEFFTHFSFLVEQLHRVLVPGRIIAVHCMDLPTHKNSGEEIGLRDFSGDIIKCFQKHDFIFHSRHCIWKDPLIAATRTKAIGLAHKQLIKDSAISRTGIPDYIVAFRKKGENPKPIPHPDGLTEYHGSRHVPHELDRFLQDGKLDDQSKNKRSHWIWQQYASPVWFDIRQTRTLPYKEGRAEEDEKHICLARDSLVLTRERGYIPIQDVIVGENVLTHVGRWRPVLTVQQTGNRRAIKVNAQGVPGLTLTPDHKLWMRKSDWVRQREGAELVDPKWIEAQHSIGGYVNFKLPEVEEFYDNPDLWWIVGRWIADGHWDSRQGLHISCGKHKLPNLLKQLGSYAGVINDTGTSLQIRLLDRNGDIREIVSECGRGASNKHIPARAFTLPWGLAKQLLDGYLSGDGHYVPNRHTWMATTVSRPLALGISMLAHAVYGAIASVRKGRPEREAIIEGRKVFCKQEWVVSFDIPKDSRYKKAFILEDGAWKKVRSVVDAGEVETWNLRVADDESYTAEGCIVKNCPLQLDVIERCLTLWTAADDVVLTPFMGIGSEVYVAVKNGRRSIGIELKPSYYKLAKRNLNHLDRKNKTRLV